MKLTIFGATGATGTCLTGQALAAGHDVTAVVRDPARLAVPAHPRLRTVVADVLDPASITPAIAGADAVITAVGPRGTGPTTIIQDSVRSIIQAMQKTGTRRLLEISGSIVADEGESPYMRYLVKPVARRTCFQNGAWGQVAPALQQPRQVRRTRRHSLGHMRRWPWRDTQRYWPAQEGHGRSGASHPEMSGSGRRCGNRWGRGSWAAAAGGRHE